MESSLLTTQAQVEKSRRIPLPPPNGIVDRLGTPKTTIRRVVTAHCPIIVGGGPAGLAVAASLRRLSVPSIILERSDGVADLWRRRTYNRLSLHLSKNYCELPHLPFPANFPTYPSKSQFLHYLHSYAHDFSLHPIFGCTVATASFDTTASLWRVAAVHRDLSDLHVQSNSLSQLSDSLSESSYDMSEESADSSPQPVELEVVEYVSPWLVVATGENAEPVVPKLTGREKFKGSMRHSSEYKSGEEYEGKRVLVVGCGNSGMEISLDLCDYGAIPFMSVRSSGDIWDRYIWAGDEAAEPVRWVDRILLMASWMVFGNTENYGLKTPEVGPLELKNSTGKTPVLDVGAVSFIKSGRIQVVPEVEPLTSAGAKFVDGREMGFDSVIFATGYRSNVSTWLKDSDFFSENGKPKIPFPHGWKRKNGLYCVGFTGRGLPGVSADAIKTAHDIAESWKNYPESKQEFCSLSHSNNNKLVSSEQGELKMGTM